MPEITITPPVGASQQDLLAALLGVKAQPFNPLLASSSSSPTSGRIFGTAVAVASGTLLTGVKLRLAIAAAGTLPTTARFGLADNTGKMLTQSGNLNALASWPTGVAPFAFTPAFTTTYSGIYFPVFIVNGTWGSTQPTLIGTTTSAATSNTADGSNPMPNFTWTGQTDLPANGATLTMNADNRIQWIALY